MLNVKSAWTWSWQLANSSEYLTDVITFSAWSVFDHGVLLTTSVRQSITLGLARFVDRTVTWWSHHIIIIVTALKRMNWWKSTSKLLLLFLVGTSIKAKDNVRSSTHACMPISLRMVKITNMNGRTISSMTSMVITSRTLNPHLPIEWGWYEQSMRIYFVLNDFNYSLIINSLKIVIKFKYY